MKRAFELEASSDRIRFWSDKRLPFEPTGELLSARNELAMAIRAMTVPDACVLHATYVSQDASFFDVENVLFYNVGNGCFATATMEGLSFVRREAVPATTKSGQRFAHFHEYCFKPIPSKTSDELGLTISFELPCLSKVNEVWWFATGAHPAPQFSINGPFFLSVHIETSKRPVNTATILKPLLDGVIASLHSQSNPTEIAVNRLAEALARDAQDVQSRLIKPPNPILGQRRLLSEYRNSIKWNPADHLCHHCELTITCATRNYCSVSIRPLDESV
ncbi:MAG: hypothetical protein U0930_13460 [Pirellulales bacterium]